MQTTAADRAAVLVCGLGAVGNGIAAAFKQAGWTVTTVDPSIPHADIKLRLEEIDDTTFFKLCSVSEIVYAAELGNRDQYANDSTLAPSNSRRFTSFIERVKLVNPTPGDVHVTYAGGSWTRRQAVGLEVSDASRGKTAADGANPYEIAKSEAAKLAEVLSARHEINISFWDWISVVPNFAPNFTISKVRLPSTLQFYEHDHTLRLT